jgi:hypothetical protein
MIMMVMICYDDGLSPVRLMGKLNTLMCLNLAQAGPVIEACSLQQIVDANTQRTPIGSCSYRAQFRSTFGPRYLAIVQGR